MISRLVFHRFNFDHFDQSLMKQSSLDEQEQLGMEMESQQQENEDEISDDYRPCSGNGVGNNGSATEDPSVTNMTSTASTSTVTNIAQQRPGGELTKSSLK